MLFCLSPFNRMVVNTFQRFTFKTILNAIENRLKKLSIDKTIRGMYSNRWGVNSQISLTS